MKNLKKTLTVLFLISTCLFLSSCDKSTDDTVEPTKATIAKAGKVYSSYYMENTNKGLLSVVVGEVKAGSSVFILENRNWDYKIQLADGTMGWIESEYLKPSKHTFIMYQSDRSDIVSSPGEEGREIVKEVTEKTVVSRLEEYQEVKKVRGKDNVTNWTKIRTEDGIEGWFNSGYLYQVAIDPMRFINRKDWSFSMNDFLEEWKGESIEQFTEKFKEPSGIKIADGPDIYYFNNIFLFQGVKKYYCIRVYVNDSLIENIDAARSETSWVSFLPFSSVLRINLIGNYIGNYNYIFENTHDIDGTTINIKDYMPNWIAYTIGLLLLLIYLVVLFFGILRIPFIIVNKITHKQSMNRKLFNGRIMLYATSGTIILGYVFSLIMLVNVFPFNDYSLISAIFCVGMIVGNIGKWRNDLDYNRCNAATCHQWTGEHSWAEDLGGETVKRTYSDGQTRSKSTRRYREHRKCTACGNTWSIIRTSVIGGLKY